MCILHKFVAFPLKMYTFTCVTPGTCVGTITGTHKPGGRISACSVLTCSGCTSNHCSKHQRCKVFIHCILIKACL